MLRQIRIRYDPVEDRLLLSLVVDAKTHHLLLTRRVWAVARQALQHLLDLSAEVPDSLPRVVRNNLSAANHQATVALTPTEREPAQSHGAPNGAVLVSGLKFGQRKPPAMDFSGVRRSWILQFDVQGQPSLRLNLNDRTLHALVGGLLQREETAEWCLPPLPALAMPTSTGTSLLQ